MATLPVKNMQGADNGAFEVDESWLVREKGSQAVKDSVVAFLAGCRAGTASTKTRGNVSGGGSKPWRQKGTGRARSGSSRSPVWRGGGIVFGPLPRSYAQKINNKVEKLALKRSFTDRVDANEVIVVDELVMDTPKTKAMVSFLNTIGAGDNVLIIVDEYTDNVLLSMRNLPKVNIFRAASVNTYWMLRYKKIVITKAGLEALGTRLG